MRHLEELEQKVLRLIQKNLDLRIQLDELTKEHGLLLEQVKHFEVSLLKEASTSKTLNEEKTAIVHTIEELLNSINALENAQ